MSMEKHVAVQRMTRRRRVMQVVIQHFLFRRPYVTGSEIVDVEK